jgi:hypothetical protein
MAEAKRLGASVQKAYEAYRSMDIDALKKIYGRSHRVSDLSGLSKGSLITDILRGELGDRKVDAWAQAY